MADEKVTIMKLKVDLHCSKCYKKVKKVLCKFPQIRDQTYDEKQGIVIIKVVCCNPERLRDKLCCKGGGSIKSIEIVEPPKPKPPEPPKPKPKPAPAPCEPPKPAPPPPKPAPPPCEPPKPKPAPPPCEPPKPAPPPCEPPKPAPPPCEPPKPAPKPPKPAPPPCEPPPVCYPHPHPHPHPYPHPPAGVPIGTCCTSCYEGRPGGPCFQGYGGPPICYDGYYGRPVYDSYGGGRPCYVSRCDQYLSEENPQGCTVM